MADEQTIVAWIRANIDFSQFANKMQAMGAIMKHFGKGVDGKMHDLFDITDERQHIWTDDDTGDKIAENRTQPQFFGRGDRDCSGSWSQLNPGSTGWPKRSTSTGCAGWRSVIPTG